jgi:hypothetical protein
MNIGVQITLKSPVRWIGTHLHQDETLSMMVQ